ncbi:hypothetical protein EUX98_g2268 [Antrodiella citrinella]|uniref:Uncharacterized protein n=1 Tax=Antrodiella citrinella TaxID=2447956 RepID=A0A4S4MZD2_9APHY|nr:hypothetical protein EUX98_g2268 [Antrodiella citrinella]
MPTALPMGNTHPNGKWFIAIHEVQAVYGRDEPLPLQAFVMGGLPAGTSVQSLVTVQHVADAMKAWPGQPATEPMPQPEHKPEPELVTVTPLAPTPRPAPAQARAATRPQRGVRRQHSATQTTRTTSFTPETTGPSHQGGSNHLAASLVLAVVEHIFESLKRTNKIQRDTSPKQALRYTLPLRQWGHHCHTVDVTGMLLPRNALHPNNRALIEIMNVTQVYRLALTPPLRFYQRDPELALATGYSNVTAWQVQAAIRAMQGFNTVYAEPAQPSSEGSDVCSSTAADESESTVTTPEERLHPNGKPLIKIREVSEVYDHDEYIPLRYFRPVHDLDESERVTRDTLVTVAQVERAEEAYRDAPSTDSLTADQLRAILYAVDMQWDSLSQKGDGREESNCHYGVE